MMLHFFWIFVILAYVQVGRFLPNTPLRVVVDHKGNDITELAIEEKAGLASRIGDARVRMDAVQLIQLG